ncbi:MAG: transcriptional regulator protein [ANME-2 cluster archaeon]|jgi:predicted transcriptional regulator|nr:transcriptional regulator protein [ANME-2 cluster archaeon]
MRHSEMRVFDDRDLEFIDILRNLNISRNVASTLAYLANVDEATSKDLEMGSELRQPEVSIAMRELRTYGWLDEREIKKEGKGRPMKVYKLAVPMNEIVLHLEEKTRQEAEKSLYNIEKLKGISFKK